MQLRKLEPTTSAISNAEMETPVTPARIITDGRAEVTFRQGKGAAHQGGNAALDHLY
ncbi:MAG TPA: urease accessory protein UreD, partial [Thalassospira sp.]|nr:urease accessory protein UreD [Thalassospira sp.]